MPRLDKHAGKPQCSRACSHHALERMPCRFATSSALLSRFRIKMLFPRSTSGPTEVALLTPMSTEHCKVCGPERFVRQRSPSGFLFCDSEVFSLPEQQQHNP